MYIVRFVRQDGKPDEEYYYRSLKDAEYHFHLFDADDSKIYLRIVLSCYSNSEDQKELLTHCF